MTTSYVTVQSSGAEGYTNLKAWLKDMSPWLPGATRSVMKRQLILACREFFAESFALQGDMGPTLIIAGQQDYQLSPFNSYTDVVGVLSVAMNGKLLVPLWRKPDPYPNSVTGVATPTSDTPSGYYMSRPDIVSIYPLPQTPQPAPAYLTFHVALRPKSTVEQVPSVTVTHFYDAILCGGLYRMMNQPAKPYTNLELAAYHEKRFRSYIGEWAAKAKTGFNGSASWKYPGFGK